MSLCQCAREGAGDSSFRASPGIPQVLKVTTGWNSFLSGAVCSRTYSLSQHKHRVRVPSTTLMVTKPHSSACHEIHEEKEQPKGVLESWSQLGHSPAV